MKKILEVKDLRINIEVEEGTLHAVRGIDFDVFENDSLGIVGESGSGKSISMKAIMGLLPEGAYIEDGSIIFRNNNITKASEKEWELMRGNEIAIINQNPSGNLTSQSDMAS